MTRFMICDTDTKFLDALASTLHQVFNPCSVEYMYGPYALEVSLRSERNGGDVLLTEIELRDKNAIDIISKYMKTSSTLQVIYMTSKIQYCTEVYDTRHCGFLLKPVQHDMLVRDVKRALRLSEQVKTNGITIQINGHVHVINASSLLYVESHGRVMRVVTDDEVLDTYDKISNFSYQLDKRFVQCHKSYLVNMERVHEFRGDSFVMVNNVVIPISQSKRKEVRQRFLEYMGVSNLKK